MQQRATNGVGLGLPEYPENGDGIDRSLVSTQLLFISRCLISVVRV